MATKTVQNIIDALAGWPGAPGDPVTVSNSRRIWYALAVHPYAGVPPEPANYTIITTTGERVGSLTVGALTAALGGLDAPHKAGPCYASVYDRDAGLYQADIYSAKRGATNELADVLGGFYFAINARDPIPQTAAPPPAAPPAPTGIAPPPSPAVPIPNPPDALSNAPPILETTAPPDC